MNGPVGSEVRKADQRERPAPAHEGKVLRRRRRA